MNRPPLPPQISNHNHNQWDTLSRTDSFSSVSNPPQCYPNHMNHQKPFIGQVQAGGVSPIRRPVPLPEGNVQGQPQRNMSASVFNLNQGGYPQPQLQQQNPWGMNQVKIYSLIIFTS